MAVYTEVSFEEAAALLRTLGLGELGQLQGIKGGIENTNYFVNSTRDGVALEHVLTLFERLPFEQLPFYLQLMRHLAAQGIAVPNPAATAQGQILHCLRGKPAAVVNKLRGQPQLRPTPAHCRAVGQMLARMHLAGASFPLMQPNLRGLAWWNETVPVVLPYLNAAQASLMQTELAFQNHIAAQAAFAVLPRGPIHADLFRDNALFDGPELTGFFDFYFAGHDAFLFDIAVCLNDWCVRHSDDEQDGSHEAPQAQAFIEAYQAVRPLERAEWDLMRPMLRAAALRFWLSRLWDLHLPRKASMLQAHDPAHFERVLLDRVQRIPSLGA